MNSGGSLPLGFVFLAGALLCFSQPVAASRLRIEKVSIEALVRKDGSVHVSERRVFGFRGRFDSVAYALAIGEGVAIDSFQVREGSRVYVSSSVGREGRLRIQRCEGKLSARWFFRAADQSRVFEISYTLCDAVLVYGDVAEFAHQFVGAVWPEPSREVVLRIGWESQGDLDSVRAWPRGPWWAEQRVRADGRLELSVRPLPARQAYGVHIVFPTAWVPQAHRRVNKTGLEAILSQESRRSQQTALRRCQAQERFARRRHRRQHAWWFLSFLSLAAVVVSAQLCWSYGRPHAVADIREREPKPPSLGKPASVAYLARGSGFGSEVLVATLLDLANRGHLAIEERWARRGFVPKRMRVVYDFARPGAPQDRGRLDPHEAELLDFLFQDVVGGGESVTTEQLRKNARKVLRWYVGWRRRLLRRCSSLGLFEAESFRARNKILALAGTLVVIGGVGLGSAGPAGLLPVSTGIFLFASAFFFPRRIPEAERELRWWKAYVRHVEGQARANNNTGRFAFPGALPYAVALGVKPKVLRAMSAALADPSALQWFRPPDREMSFGESFARMLGAVVSTCRSLTSISGA